MDLSESVGQETQNAPFLTSSLPSLPYKSQMFLVLTTHDMCSYLVSSLLSFSSKF